MKKCKNSDFTLLLTEFVLEYHFQLITICSLCVGLAFIIFSSSIISGFEWICYDVLPKTDSIESDSKTDSVEILPYR